MQTIASIFRLSILSILGASLWAQAPASKPVVGTVQAADAANRTLTIKADDGSETIVRVAATARVSQIPAGETSLQNAKPAELSAVGVGDRVIARGVVADGTLNATLVVLMSRTDIAKKQQQEQMLWATKGVSGMVTAVDKAANTVTINYRGTEGVKPMKITIAEKANVKRYSEGSVKFADATVSSIAEIDVNDQVRALGAKSDDGLAYKADHLVSGAFRNIAATVRSIDLANGVMEVIDLDTKKPLQVKVGKEASLKKLPVMAATMMAMSMNGGAAGMGGGAAGGPPAGMPMRPQQGAGARGAGGPAAGGPAAGGAPGPGGPGMGGMRRPAGGDMMSMAIDRSPAIQLSDLKKDDPLILSVGKTKEPNKVVAITILAGVEPILATPANGSRASQLGTWNLDGGAGMMGGGGGGGMGGPPQ